jgi:hypothetical protein
MVNWIDAIEFTAIYLHHQKDLDIQWCDFWWFWEILEIVRNHEKVEILSIEQILKQETYSICPSAKCVFLQCQSSSEKYNLSRELTQSGDFWHISSHWSIDRCGSKFEAANVLRESKNLHFRFTLRKETWSST